MATQSQKKKEPEADIPPYRTTSIEAADAPDGGAGDNWFRYTITQGRNTITGYRRGTLRTVTSAVKEIVVELNERRSGRRGRVHLTPSRRNK